MYYEDYTEEPQYDAAAEAAFLAADDAEADSHYNAAADAQTERERQQAVADHRCSRCGRRLPAYMFTTVAGSGICNDCI